ncbi:sterile alpha motif domain-containing protein 9-like isoform X2 [Hypomesus transpacificus]|uniref:sterile alpha motif domain-containing protein 9-like isoform X2 n=1 Tax=Hypomesus transpacificus TaxID=137520 RepID=UPI001F076452|nr:sterile alpha motif domain-containing protein 9-like isoform X2 [Hypomesus transpacificus]
MEQEDMLPVEEWTEVQVSSWLRTIGVKEQYITRIKEEEVNGTILLELTEDFLRKEFEMKSGPALLILKKRDSLLKQRSKVEETPQSAKNIRKGSKKHKEVPEAEHVPKDTTHPEQSVGVLTTKRDCKPRPFDKEGIDSTYVKHNVLQPESGAFDLISPCHEYKSFTIAATLDRTRLQAKFAKEVLKFGSGCMNIRSNGTIHFGVMDSRDDAGYVHGEIIGFPVPEKDMYVDALDYIEKSCSSHSEHMRQCIRPPRFIEVLDMDSAEKRYVVEVDIVPSVSVVRKKMYSVRLPNFKESNNKIDYEKDTFFRRVGSKTEPVSDQLDFFKRVEDRDALRDQAEHCQYLSTPCIGQDLGRKLTMLVTNGKKFIEKEKWYILVANKFRPDDLRSIDHLLNMNIFCVFDFDADSKVSGLCSKYIQHRAANMHFMQNYKIPSGMPLDQFVSHLHLFEQTSWIFCNGRKDYKGNENPCDEMTWIKTKMTLLRESVSLICKQILPKGTFLVLFLLTSPVEKPLLHTFFEFFTDMEGHDDIICISESEENYQKWQSFAEGSCGTETVNRFSVVGMKMSHVDATLQQIQPVTSRATKHLPIFVKGQCLLETREEERMYSLEIISMDHCNETTDDFIKSNKDTNEREFYHGGKVTWLNFWLAEKGYVGEVIQRDAYREISEILTETLKWSVEQFPVNSINIYHHPGSGGSTVARQIMWNNRKDLRCAIVKPSYSAAIVAEHAVQLREYEERDPQKCVPVLLLIEDCDKENLNDLRNELENAMNTKKIKQGQCFILLSCRRSHNPEKMCKDSPLNNVSVTHQLSPEEKIKFAGKVQKLEKQYNIEFILTFVLMSVEFKHQKIVEYVENFVKHLLQDIDRKDVVTRLIHYVALLNTYVPNSFISQSHWEALMPLPLHMDRFRQHTFEKSLSDPAKLVLVHLKDVKTHIESLRIIHPLVAKEILQQLLGDQKLQSCLAMNLLREDVLFEHRFGREEYVKFLRALFMRRCRISNGDEYDSFFSPLIEHVCANETPATAIELLTQAYQRFNKDAFFAQQLARLNYTHEKFEEAKHWAEMAAKQMPCNSYILDTKGQVYRKWFHAKFKVIEKVAKTPENTADAVETALRAIDCFKECENAAISDRENMNNSGFFATVEVGCSLLKLIFSLHIFSNKAQGHSECMKYLLTEYIPEELRKPWEPFHNQLKQLQMRLHASLEWISEDLSYFQTDIDADEAETIESPEIISYPLKWLVKKSTEYGKYFCEASTSTALSQSNPATLTPFMKRLIIYRLGGGNVTTVFSIMTDPKEKHPAKVLENIISLYPSNPQKARLEQMDLVNYIAVHIALSCMSTQSPKLASLKDLQTLSQQFPTDKRKCLPSALFLLTLLFWPEDDDTDKENKYDMVQSAVECLKKSYWTKMKDVPTRKRRIYTHFFLSNGSGWNKIVHKSKVEANTKILSVSEKRMKWFRGEAWKMPEIAHLLKTVSGWTEDGVIYLTGPKQRTFCIPPLNIASVPYSNENITFYLGFTFRGPVAYNITVKE